MRGGANLGLLLQRGPSKNEAKHIYGNSPSVDSLLKSRRWDFVVMNDYSQAPALPERRDETLALLRKAPPGETGALRLLLDKCAATPIVYQTWGYRAAQKDSDKIGDFGEMSHQLAAGCNRYRAALGGSALLAPVGTAYQLVHKERPELWHALYHTDDYHPSCLGTYLAAATIYATIQGKTLSSAALDPFQDGLCAPAIVSRVPTRAEREYFLDVAGRVAALYTRQANEPLEAVQDRAAQAAREGWEGLPGGFDPRADGEPQKGGKVAKKAAFSPPLLRTVKSNQSLSSTEAPLAFLEFSELREVYANGNALGGANMLLKALGCSPVKAPSERCRQIPALNRPPWIPRAPGISGTCSSSSTKWLRMKPHTTQ